MWNNIIKSFSIQEIVNTISREDFNAFLNKFLSTSNIDKMNNLLNILHDRLKNEIQNIRDEETEPVYKTVYHYIMLSIYNEAITLDHAIEKLNESTPQPTFFKEYYTKLCGFGETNGNAIYREYFVRDYIVNIYHHRTDVLSYKDISNIKNEFSRIWNSLTEEEQNCAKTLMRIINNNETIEDGSVCPENFYKWFTRINDESADCEKNIELLSYILNKDKYSLNKNEICFIDGYEDNIDSSVLLSLLLKIKKTTINY